MTPTLHSELLSLSAPADPEKWLEQNNALAARGNVPLVLNASGSLDAIRGSSLTKSGSVEDDLLMVSTSFRNGAQVGERGMTVWT